MSFLNDLKNIFTNGEPIFTPIEMWNKPRGTLGEFRTNYVLNNEALKELSYIRTISNVYVENNGNYTEIDVIALTDKGIYVMESKNYKGWIYGRADDTNWTQCFKNGEKYKFYNPVKQNEGHINKLSQYLGIERNKMFSFIIFSDLCTLKSDVYKRQVPYSAILPGSLSFLSISKYLYVYFASITSRSFLSQSAASSAVCSSGADIP